MPAKWQQWMPLNIDKWRGSPAVQAMHPCARIGYLYLLMYAWQSDDCTIPSDPFDLAEISGLGDELWATHSPRILRKFEPVGESGRLRNQVCFEEWSEAKKRYEDHLKGAQRTNSARSPKESPRSANAELPPTEAYDDAQRDTYTYTNTSTETNTKSKEQKPAAKKKPSRVGGWTQRQDGRRGLFRGALEEYWRATNPKGPALIWQFEEDTEFEKLLTASPDMTLEQFQNFLRNRARSDGVAHGDRIHIWIANITKYSEPLDRFGKAKTNGGTHAAVPRSKADENLAVLAESLARGKHQGSLDEDGDLPSSEDRSGEPRTLHGDPASLRPESLSSGDGEFGRESERPRPDRAPIPW